MNNRIALFGIILSITMYSSAQNFEQIDVELPGYYQNSLEFGDFNMDGFLDVLQSGKESGHSFYSSISLSAYDGESTYTPIDLQNVIPVMESFAGAAIWVDMNKDGYVDIVHNGGTTDNPSTRASILYNNGDNTFTKQIVGDGKCYGNTIVMDFDNDCDFDILLTGTSRINLYENETAILYKNNGDNTFTKISLDNVISAAYGKGLSKDINHDGYADIILEHNEGLGADDKKSIKVFINNGDLSFSEDLSLSITSNYSISLLEIEDFDSDGKYDILYSLYNYDLEKYITNLQLGNGTSITNSGININDNSPTKIGDLDNDGDIDIVNVYSDSLFVFYNDGTGRFPEYEVIFTGFTDLTTINICDYDVDGDLDIFISYRSENDFRTEIIRNNINTPNTGPTMQYTQTKEPQIIGNRVFFSWNRPDDDTTPSKAIKYNLFIAEYDTINNAILNITCPNHNGLDNPYRPFPIPDAKRMISYPQFSTIDTFAIRFLDRGVYLATIQAVDNSYHSDYGSYSWHHIFKVKDETSSCSSPKPIVINDTICGIGAATLQATNGNKFVWYDNIYGNILDTAEIFQTPVVTESTSFYVANIDSICESERVIVMVILYDNPVVSTDIQEDYISIDKDEIELIGAPLGGIFEGEGVSGYKFVPSQAGLGKSIISYSYTNDNDCMGYTETSVIVYDTTGIICTKYDSVSISVTDTLIIDAVLTDISPPFNVNTIKVYPNPAKDHLFINTGSYGLMVNYQLNIINELGITVFESYVNEPLFEINLSDWSGEGLYFLQLIDAENKIMDIKKIILK